MKKTLAILCALSMLLLSFTAFADETAFEFAQLEGMGFSFSSGAGAWFTAIEISADGTLRGYFHDSDMGDTGEGYENGTVYECEFTAALTAPVMGSDGFAHTTVGEVVIEGDHEAEEIEDGIRYVASDPAGVNTEDELVIYQPGTEIAKLPEGYLSWAHLEDYGEIPETLPFWGIYNKTDDSGFVGEMYAEDLSSAYADESALPENTKIVMPEASALDEKNLPAETVLEVYLDADAVQEDSLIADVYAKDTYSTASIQALQPGDAVYVMGEYHIVDTAEADQDGVVINGELDGYGIRFAADPQDAEKSYVELDNDLYAISPIGAVSLPWADTVTLTSVRFDADGGVLPDPVTETVNGTEISALLNGYFENCVVFEGLAFITVTNHAVTAVNIPYQP